MFPNYQISLLLSFGSLSLMIGGFVGLWKKGTIFFRILVIMGQVTAVLNAALFAKILV